MLDLTPTDSVAGLPPFSNSSFAPPTNSSCEFAVHLLTFEALFFGLLGTGVNLVGVVGNVVSLAILVRAQKRSASFVYLIALTVTDVVWLVIASWEWNLTFVSRNMKLQHQLLNPVQDFLREFNELVNTWVLVVFCVQRCRAVMRPLEAHARQGRTHVGATVGLICIFAFLSNVPRFFEVSYVESVDACDDVDNNYNVTYVKTVKTRLRLDRTYIWTYKIVYTYVVRFVAPLALLCFCNINIIAAVRKEGKFRKNSTVLTVTSSSLKSKASKSWAKSTEQQVTLICISIVSAFVLTSFPYFLSSVLKHSELIDQNAAFKLYRNCAIGLTNFNCCLIFVIFFLLSPQYRKLFHQMFLRRNGGGANDFSNSVDPPTKEKLPLR